MEVDVAEERSALDDAIIEDTWHCPSCGAAVLLGDDDREPCTAGWCHACGNPLPVCECEVPPADGDRGDA